MKGVRDKRLVSTALMVTFLAFVIASTLSAQAHPEMYVRVYVWNPTTGDNIYPALAYPAPTYVEVWINSPDAWYDTPDGIVGVTMSLQVDPSVVEVLSAQAIPDMDFGGFPDSFLGDFLEDAHTWDGFSTFFTVGTVDKPSGTITGTGEVILGFTTLGLGAGSGPKPLWRFIIRTRDGVDPATAYSPITLFNVEYNTVDGAKHPVDVVEDGIYGAEPAPEFPLGLGLMMAIAPAIPIVYLWRTRKKEKKQ